MTDYALPGAGVFPAHLLRRAVDDGLIGFSADTKPAIQPASIDLHLGDVAHRLRCSFLPDSTHTVEQRLEEFAMDTVDLRAGGVLERNRPYLIPLREGLDLAPNIRAKANPKSSTGRVDVFTRVITDRSYRFDEVAAGYRGQLYLEVVSSTFTIKVHPGLALNQLRLMVGHAEVDEAELAAMHARRGLLYELGRTVEADEFVHTGGVFLGLDLTGDDDGVVGYRAKRNSRLLDLGEIGGHDPTDYWEPVIRERGDQIVLEPEDFYLLLSAQGISIPPDVAGEMVAFDPTSGELRTHYAGFFDPGFGWDAEGMTGSRAALEVRAHDVPFMVQDRLRVCKIAFEKLVEPTDELYGAGIGSNYQGQQSTLSKYFRRD
ncbi:MAG TPA: 2'-deoxycytidine 5'-triphosphate deaminase [Acidimicrobiales bacterium]|nr:2'-deoxycytidine 5'-triphosphate deaminase [Acidimicrobiales bacterium]